MYDLIVQISLTISNKLIRAPETTGLYPNINLEEWSNIVLNPVVNILSTKLGVRYRLGSVQLSGNFELTQDFSLQSKYSYILYEWKFLQDTNSAIFFIKMGIYILNCVFFSPRV